MLGNLKLQRPIAFTDVETTGTNPNSDRGVELSMLKIHPDGHEEYKSHRVNPGVAIPAEAPQSTVLPTRTWLMSRLSAGTPRVSVTS
jgi:DNA polymerase III epsilon subunit-like protein